MQIEDKVSQILNTKNDALITVQPTATVFDALKVIAEKNVGSVLVMQGATLLGLFSEREYARNVALQGRNSRDTKVTEVMRAPPLTVSPETSLDEAMHLMTDHRVRHLPVVSGSRVVGIISIGDIVKWVISEQERTIAHLQCYITGQYDTVFTRA
ncbi:MAG: CBS domain-containing protein [Acidobacteriaceae bacterium]|nr:CBS domain-containing protein [Acidobacteriaceae bacterium]